MSSTPKQLPKSKIASKLKLNVRGFPHHDDTGDYYDILWEQYGPSSTYYDSDEEFVGPRPTKVAKTEPQESEPQESKPLDSKPLDSKPKEIEQTDSESDSNRDSPKSPDYSSYEDGPIRSPCYCAGLEEDECRCKDQDSLVDNNDR